MFIVLTRLATVSVAVCCHEHRRMRILLLGGVAESKTLARALIERGHLVIYSLVGLVRKPDLPCKIHVGGFSNMVSNQGNSTDKEQRGVQGLVAYCKHQRIELLLDATHPYADKISANAVAAARQLAIPCWRLDRQGWNPDNYLNWHSYHDWDDLIAQIIRYNRPFFSIGISALKLASQRPQHQQWIVRSARPFPVTEGIIQLVAIGPFSYEDECALMLQHKVDALISKNSGCSRVARKLDAALALDIPVFVQTRPALPEADRCFERIDAVVDALAYTGISDAAFLLTR